MRILMCFFVSMLAAAPAFGQGKGHGYVFAAPGGVSGDGQTSAALHLGAGGEALVHRGLGVGAEIGYLANPRLLAGAGLLSVNGSYHFASGQPAAKAVPFITGGYSLGFRSGVANLVNVGGGVNYWFKDQLGLRVEFRDHLYASEVHLWSFRFGLAFR